MNRVLTAAVGALTIATTIAASTATADANGFNWGLKKPYWGYGIAAGVLTAAAFGVYAACDRIPMYDRFGNYIGSRRVCGFY